jgi:hypothetical protein
MKKRLAHICSQNILQQIGGIDGEYLPDLSLKQLLDLVAWVETFRATIYEIFPDLSKVTASKRTYEDNAPKLLVENSKTIDVALAEDSLVWVNNTLWNIHNNARDEFLFKTKEMAEVWLERGYRFVYQFVLLLQITRLFFSQLMFAACVVLKTKIIVRNEKSHSRRTGNIVLLFVKMFTQ